MRRDLCLFAHYDRDGQVAPHVVRYVKAIVSSGFDVVFISACWPRESELAPLRAYCAEIILRENAGYDFGSWAEGFRRYRGTFGGDLLLANDSVYGPIGDLREAIAQLSAIDADMRGMVQSFEHAPHLQSWFVLASQRVHTSDVFASILCKNFRGSTKDEIIAEGEITLSTALVAAGFNVGALFQQDGLCIGRAFNPTHYLWRELVEQVGIPFIKVELLNHNPCRISQLSDWKQVVAPRALDLQRMMEDHLDRLHRADPGSVDVMHSLRAHPWDAEAWFRRAFRLRAGWYPLCKLNALGYMICRAIRYLLRGGTNAG